MAQAEPKRGGGKL